MTNHPCSCPTCLVHHYSQPQNNDPQDLLTKKLTGYKLSGYSETFSFDKDTAGRLAAYVLGVLNEQK